jgi:hypothetical protein
MFGKVARNLRLEDWECRDLGSGMERNYSIISVFFGGYKGY